MCIRDRDGWDEEAAKWFQRKAEEKQAAAG
jgi:hypothetical protein